MPKADIAAQGYDLSLNRITGLGERTARSLLAELLKDGILSSASDNGAVFLRFRVEHRDVLFPRLFAGICAASNPV